MPDAGNAVVRALTVRQPWASLIALGTKRIETRSWSTRYRGPLAIHAGAHRPEHLSRVGEWSVHSQFTEPESGPELRRLGSVDRGVLVPDRHERGLAAPMPLGAVVAVVDLLDVVPMVDDCDDLPDTPACLEVLGSSLRLWADGAAELGDEVDVSDQRPFGDFTPGRFAWLLGNVQPLDVPVPAKGKQGLWTWEDR